MIFRRIVLSALLVGALSGLLLSAIEFWRVIPIIHAAERFEDALAARMADAARGTKQEHGAADHVHAEGTAPPGGENGHSASEWQPAEGAERIGYTLLANFLTATGFALLTLVAMVAALKRNPAATLDWRYGLLWGAAGYAIFFVAPALGLPPEIPGAADSPLGARQAWWWFSVACTAAGLAGAVFGKSPWRWAALGFLALPYLAGAPQLPASPFAAHLPADAAELAVLSRRFVWETAFANALYWLALGSASSWAVRRFLGEAIQREVRE
jgi:cobalt transporter subunit CbtA